MESTERATTSLTLERFAARPVLLVAAGLFVLEMALSGRYGFHGDELYFLDSARHLQGGYVDQPILIPLLARASLSLFGVWLPGLRLWAALAVAATVVIAGLLARELGGRRNAQLLAALATARCRPSCPPAAFWRPRRWTSCSGRGSRWWWYGSAAPATVATGCWADWSWG